MTSNSFLQYDREVSNAPQVLSGHELKDQDLWPRGDQRHGPDKKKEAAEVLPGKKATPEVGRSSLNMKKNSQKPQPELSSKSRT